MPVRKVNISKVDKLFEVAFVCVCAQIFIHTKTKEVLQAVQIGYL